MNKTLYFKDTNKINSTLKVMERNLEILNRNYNEIKYLNFGTVITILGSDYLRFENELKEALKGKIKESSSEKIRDVFEVVVQDLEQFEEESGAWFYNYVRFDTDTNKFYLVHDYKERINDSYTYKCKEDKLITVLSNMKDLIQENK
jgi:quinol monooxygenase YgiN